MQIVNSFPPNHNQIKQFIPHTKGNVYCYGSQIYAPDSTEIPEDIIFHEATHKSQQERFTNPDLWWQQYCFDKDFRLQEELEAYANQYQWVKKYINSTAAAYMLEEAAFNLKEIYGLSISHGEAKSKIRNR